MSVDHQALRKLEDTPETPSVDGTIADANAEPLELFKGLPPARVAEILPRLKSAVFPTGSVIVREGQMNPPLYLVEHGVVTVWRGEPNTRSGVLVARLTAGSCFGDMCAVRPGAASASIVASEEVRLRELTLADLPVADRVRRTVAMNLARVVATRLVSTQENVFNRHQEQVATTARVAATSDFVTRILVALACCMFSLPTIAARESSAGERTLFSLAFAALFFGIAWFFLRGNHFEHALLGMKRRDWSRQLRGALPCTLTMMAAILVGKIILGDYGWFDASVFEPMRAPTRYGLQGGLGWTMLAIVFMLAGVAVEFTRCTLQGSLAFLFGSSRHLATWGANIAANTLCAATQVHVGVVSTLLIFSCGLFWGWLFARQRSFFAVAFSHAVVGLWAGFILGLPE